MFGRYQLRELVAVSGMGVVYRAWDPTLECVVAIKLVSEDTIPDESARQQLTTEARIASSLNHPNICVIKNVVEESGQAGIVMEWVEGQVLTHIIPAQVGLPADHVVSYGIEIAEAVSHAHEHDVVHRDLKSGNVMVTAGGHIKLLDFGLSKIQRRIEVPNFPVNAEITSSSDAIVGTPPYWAPEVLKHCPSDPRSDIWSLGVLLYEMAAGRMPFSGGTVIELGSAILKDPPAPLPQHVPGEVSKIIGRCLEKEIGRRYQQVSEIRAALEAIEPDSRNPATRRPRRVPEQLMTVRSVAVLPLENRSAATEQEYFADGLTESLITTLAKNGGLRVISRTSIMQYKHTKKTLRQVARELSVDAIVEGSVLRDGDRVRINAELIEGRTDQLLWAEAYERDLRDILSLQSQLAATIAGEIRAKLSPGEGPSLNRPSTPISLSAIDSAMAETWGPESENSKPSIAVNPQAYDLYLKGRYFWHNPTTEQDFRRAIACYEQAIEIDPTSALTYAGLANTLIRLGTGEYGLVAPAEIMPEAKLHALKAISLDETVAEAHVSLAMVKFRFELDWAGAEKEFVRAIELKDGDAVAHYMYSVYLMTLSRFEDGLKEVKLAQQLNPLSPAIHFSLGLLLYLSRQYEEAIEQLRGTMAKYPSFALAGLTLGLALMRKGMFEEGVQEIEAALAIAGPVPLWQGFLGQAFARAGRNGDALNTLHELSVASKQRYVPPSAIALVYAGVGKFDEAFEWLDQAVTERDGLLIYLKVGSVFDSLRSDKRFTELMKRVGLQEDTGVDVRHRVEADPGPSPIRRWRPATAGKVVLAAGLVGIALLYYFLHPQPPSRMMLAVEPFRNVSGDPQAQQIGGGLREELFTLLSQLIPDRLHVRELATDAGLSPERKCNQADATYILTGGVERAGNTVVITDQLLSCKDRTIIVGGRHEGDLTNDSFIRIELRIAEEIVQQILTALPGDAQPQHQVNPQAYGAYLKGRHLWAERTTQSLTDAVGFFQKAIELDQTYAPSYAGLADSYSLLGSVPQTALLPSDAFPRAEANARKALALDEGLAEAHVSLGYAELVYDRNYSEAEKEFRRALQLRPDYATAHQYYAYYLTAMGRLDEAIVERKQAITLEPASPLLNAALGEAYYFAHQFDESIAQNQEALHLDRNYAVAVINLGRAYEQKGMYPQALHAFQSILAFAPEDPVLLAFLGHIYAVSGQRPAAEKIISRLQQMNRTKYVPSIYIALVYTGLGDKDQAFNWLNKAYDERCDHLIYLSTEPLADPLRRDPRFDALLARLGLAK